MQDECSTLSNYFCKPKQSCIKLQNTPGPRGASNNQTKSRMTCIKPWASARSPTAQKKNLSPRASRLSRAENPEKRDR